MSTSCNSNCFAPSKRCFVLYSALSHCTGQMDIHWSARAFNAGVWWLAFRKFYLTCRISEEDFSVESNIGCMGAHPLYGALSLRGLHSIKLAYHHTSAGWPAELTASDFNPRIPHNSLASPFLWPLLVLFVASRISWSVETMHCTGYTGRIVNHALAPQLEMAKRYDNPLFVTQ